MMAGRTDTRAANRQGILLPGWHIENFETRDQRTPRWPVSREPVEFLPDKDGNELRVGDRVRTHDPRRSEGAGGSYGWGFTEGWVIALGPNFKDDPDRGFGPPRKIDELDLDWSSVSVRSDDGIEGGFGVSHAERIDLSAEERVEVIRRQYREALRRTDDLLDDYETHRRRLLRNLKDAEERLRMVPA